jgi:O-antigen ligase
MHAGCFHLSDRHDNAPKQQLARQPQISGMTALPSPSHHTSSVPAHWQQAMLLIAACAPVLMAVYPQPIAALLNNCIAIAAWCGFAVTLAPRWRPGQAKLLLLALAPMVIAALLSLQLGAFPQSMALSSLGMLGSAALMVSAGADLAARPNAIAVFSWFCRALLAAGVASALVGMVQVFAPTWADGVWVAAYRQEGRAAGNFRQPNHLASLLLWAMVALVSLRELGHCWARWRLLLMWGLATLLAVSMELTGSRMGALSMALLAAWGAADRRLSDQSRGLLLSLPVLYAAGYLAMLAYGELQHQAVGAVLRVTADATTISLNSRLNVWRTVLILIAQQPWTGVGFGEFNIAWALTPLPGRPQAFFDHAHNLALQLLVELGVPVGSVVLALLATAMWRVCKQARDLSGRQGTAARSGLAMVLVILLHSQLEFPLWYAYFLLPTAFIWAFVLQLPSAQETAESRPIQSTGSTPSLVGAMIAMGAVTLAVAAVLDLQWVAEIYEPTRGLSMSERLLKGQTSTLFAHHADLEVATADAADVTDAQSLAAGFEHARHLLLTPALMVAWARRCDAQQQPARASTLVQRLAEFNSPTATAFFRECTEPGGADRFQCRSPLPALPWRAFQKPAGC